MKRILLISVCLLMAILTLVGCGERVIGEYLPNYDYEREVVEELTFNVYIICGADTETNAKNTVEQRLTQYTEDKFKTTLKFFYISDTEDYAVKIEEASKPGAQNRADIVLINSEALANELMRCEYVAIELSIAKKYGKTEDDLNAITTEEKIAEFKALGTDAVDAVLHFNGNSGDKAKYEADGYHVNVIKDNYLADITSLYDTDEFGRLNVQITSSLLNASKIPTYVNVYNDKGEIIKDENGKNKIELVDKLYTVPNNRVLGQYDYVLIDKEVARHYYQSDADLAKLTNSEAIAEFTARGADAYNAVTYVSGNYEDKAIYEEQGYYVNILKYPTVTSADAFVSAFAIVDVVDDPTLTKEENKAYRELHTKRCMEIIYAFNNDETIHNTLLYGVKGTNYLLDENNHVTRVTEGNSVYHINLIYAGNVFNSYYCDEYNWNPTVAANGTKQNEQSVCDISE